MKKRLCIGLVCPSRMLISILDSIGIWYEIIDFTIPLDHYVLLIVNDISSLDDSNLQLIRHFNSEYGSILELSTKPVFYSKTVNTFFSKTIFNSKSDTQFDRITHLDIYSKCAFSSSNILSGLVDFQYKENSGSIGFLGLDMETLPTVSDYARKRLLSKFCTNPDEILNKVSLDALSDTIECSIQRLLNEQEFPFIKKWTSPSENPVFSFRIDSDYGSKESLKEIHALLTKNSIKATWFLHVKAHEEWLEFFNGLSDQELALHGYKHGYSNSISKITSNIEQGLKKLRDHNINPSGFCAPYGIWNDSLRESLTHFEFLYTSEFTSGYDSVPFFTPNTKHLQIPIHPICTGSFSRKRCSLDHIQNYFLDVYKTKKKLFKPIVFYHHPLQIGLSVFDEVLKKVNDDQLTNLTFEEYAQFWIKRSESSFSAYLENDQVQIQSSDSSLFLYTSYSPDSFDLIPSKDQSFTKEEIGTFKYETPSLPSLDELNGLQNNQFSLMKTSFIDWKNRHHL